MKMVPRAWSLMFRGTVSLWILALLGFPLGGMGGTTDVWTSVSTITSVRAVGEQLLVTVQVPAGKRRVTLETKSRLLRGSWVPREVKTSASGEGSSLTFAIPLGESMEMVRVLEETDSDVGLSDAFFQGLQLFTPVVQSESSVTGGLTPGPIAVNDKMALQDSVQAAGAGQQVVESDIWKVEGDVVYFFNQQRGLQIVDVSRPDQPVLQGFLPLSVWGEQMYRLPAQPADGSTWLALLAQQGCQGSGSEVLLVQIRNGRPTLARRWPVAGQIRETRLVGQVLHLVTYEWVQVIPQDSAAGPTTWENRTRITSLDLSAPENPVEQSVLELPTNPDAVAATDRYLFLATTGTRTPLPFERLAEWAVAGNHGVLVFDLSDPRGRVVQLGFLRTQGRVLDKFKIGALGQDQSALAVISQIDGFGRQTTNPKDPSGATTVWEWVPPSAVVETFSLHPLTTSAPLAQLTLVTNESLFGTRFSGDRAYVVTFRRVDPLWILDLQDPAKPAIRGELQIPGYSTYLQPLADNTRLLALGVDGGRTVVQLFDVESPSKPSLLSKVFLGEGWSWSEGNTDEKAFQVLADLGLVLVPWQGQRAGNTQWFQGVQLIDLDLAAGQLKARGVIEHALQARRAAVVENHIISVSAQELLTVDPVDRDHPKVVGELPLSSQVDRVFHHQGQWVEIRNAGTSPARVALASLADPDNPVATLDLLTESVVGADLRAGYLHILQTHSDEWRSETILVTNPVITKLPEAPWLSTNWVVEKSWASVRVPGTTWLTVVEVGNGSLRQVSQIKLTNPEGFQGWSLTALWPREDVLVWTESNTGWYGPMLRLAVVDALPGAKGVTSAMIPSLWWGSWWGQETRNFLAFDVSRPDAPQFASHSALGGTNAWNSFSKCWVSAGKVFMTHRLSTYLPSSGTTNTSVVNPDGSVVILPIWQSGNWEHRHYLDVVDFSDPGFPVNRPPVEVLGNLQGVSHQGSVVYTVGLDPKNPKVDGDTYLHALAYNGVQLSLIDSLPLSNTTSQPMRIASEGQVLLSQISTNLPPAIETWALSGTAKFERKSSHPLPAFAEDLQLWDDFLAVSVGDRFQFFTLEGAYQLKPIGTSERSCSLWFDWSLVAASPKLGLGIPRGYQGLWHVPIVP